MNPSDDETPIPPPRRKRNSLLSQNGRPGGFKDVFGNLTPRRASCDSTINMERMLELNQKNSASVADIHSDPLKNRQLKRNVSKVGNKKSDKFFGENLSDLSVEPVDTEITVSQELTLVDSVISKLHGKDELDAFVENNVPKHDLQNNVDKIVSNELENSNTVLSTDKNICNVDSLPVIMHNAYPTNSTVPPQDENIDPNTSFDKKAEFLMAMLEGYNTKDDNSLFLNKTPIEEPLIVPKRKHGRHICDDDERLKRIFQDSEKKIEENTREPPVTDLAKLEKLKNETDEDKVDDADHVKVEHVNIENVKTEVLENVKSIDKKVTESIKSETIELKDSIKSDLEKLIIEPFEVEKHSASTEVSTPDIYRGMEPVEEPLIIPRRAPRKHICDDDEHMHNYIHSISSKHNEPFKEITNKHEDLKINDTASPKKPSRDFSKYKKSMDLSISDDLKVIQNTEITRPIRKKERSISTVTRGFIPPQPPLRPARSTENLNGEDEKLNQLLGAELNCSPVPPTLKESQQLGTIIKKCESNSSFLTPDLMNQIVNKVYGFQMTWDDHDSISHGGYDDGSSKVSPNSKLATRKISTTRKPPIEKSIQEESNSDSLTKPTFSIGRKRLNASDQPSTMSQEESTDVVKLHIDKNGKNQEESPLNAVPTNNGSHSKNMSAIKRTATVIEMKAADNDVNENVVPTENIGSIINSLEPTEISNVLNDIYSNNKAILSDFQQYLEESQYNDKLFKAIIDQEELENKTEAKDTTVHNNASIEKLDDVKIDLVDDTFSDEDTDRPMTPPILFQRKNKLAKALSNNENGGANESTVRRGSIVEHDQWFLKHKGIDEGKQPRRNSETVSLSYDTRKLFPFGNRENTYSESSDFFSNTSNKKQSKSTDQLNVENDVKNGKSIELGVEHSSLLKYFNKEQKVGSNI